MTRLSSIIERAERGEVIDTRRELALMSLEQAQRDEAFVEDWLTREQVADAESGQQSE